MVHFMLLNQRDALFLRIMLLIEKALLAPVLRV